MCEIECYKYRAIIAEEMDNGDVVNLYIDLPKTFISTSNFLKETASILRGEVELSVEINENGKVIIVVRDLEDKVLDTISWEECHKYRTTLTPYETIKNKVLIEKIDEIPYSEKFEIIFNDYLELLKSNKEVRYILEDSGYEIVPVLNEEYFAENKKYVV